MLIKQILAGKIHQEVYTISKDQSVREAVSDLAAHRVGALVVSPDGQTVDGIVSERDIIREAGKKGLESFSLPISEIMTSKITSCEMASTAEEALKLMTDGRFRHLPVIEDGKLIGLISIGDVVKARLNEVESENSAMLGMIAGH